MAKIVSDALVVEISRIARDNESVESIVTEEMLSTLEAVVQELAGDSAVVEVRAAE